MEHSTTHGASTDHGHPRALRAVTGNLLKIRGLSLLPATPRWHLISRHSLCNVSEGRNEWMGGGWCKNRERRHQEGSPGTPGNPVTPEDLQEVHRIPLTIGSHLSQEGPGASPVLRRPGMWQMFNQHRGQEISTERNHRAWALSPLALMAPHLLGAGLAMPQLPEPADQGCSHRPSARKQAFCGLGGEEGRSGPISSPSATRSKSMEASFWGGPQGPPSPPGPAWGSPCPHGPQLVCVAGRMQQTQRYPTAQFGLPDGPQLPAGMHPCSPSRPQPPPSHHQPTGKRATTPRCQHTQAVYRDPCGMN